MDTSILVALNDSMSSREVIRFLTRFAFCRDDAKITLAHVFRKPTASEELMGEKFVEKQPSKYMRILENAKNDLVENGFLPSNITINMVQDPYPTVADGIIDSLKKGDSNVVVIGRKRMSKAEEFVLGDPSIKLVRVLEGTAVLVVKSK